MDMDYSKERLIQSSNYLQKALLYLCDGYIITGVHKLRQKIIDMDKELVVDAMFKIEEIENLKMKESRTTAYRQGELAYHSRRKWSLMLRIYFKCVENVENMTHTEIIRDMTRLQRMNMDIYHATENMMLLEDEELEAPHDDSRRSGRSGRWGSSAMRRTLVDSDAALREQLRKRSEHLRNTYLRTKPPVIDIQEELQFLDKNMSEVLLPKKYKKNTMDYDPEFVWPFYY